MCVQPIKSVRVLHVRPPTRAAHDRRNATRPHICLLGDCPTHYHPTQTQQPQGHRQNYNLLLIKWQHLASSAMCPTAHSLSLPAPWSTLTVCPLGTPYTLHENGVTLTQREPPVRISQPAAPITPRVHGPLDEWLVPSSIGSVHDLEIEDDDF